MKPYTVSWFSAGVSSAVATKIAIKGIDEIIYTHIDDQHPDTMRFVRDCERWFGKPVTVLQHRYKDVETAIRMRGYGQIKNVKQGAAACTTYLKQQMRKEWEREHQDYDLTYVWGMDIEETKPRPPKNISRVDGIREAMRDQKHLFPLVDMNMTKAEAHEILAAEGIARPAMHDLGYHNNNCVGCVKGGMGYWNKIRRDFPEVFAARARLERLAGGTILKDKNGLIYLDELDPERGRHLPPITDECGILCEIFKELPRDEEEV